MHMQQIVFAQAEASAFLEENVLFFTICLLVLTLPPAGLNIVPVTVLVESKTTLAGAFETNNFLKSSGLRIDFPPLNDEL